jgi:hypothetical protein
MMVRQLELCAHFQVTLETSFRRLTRIDDRTGATAGFNVQTSRAVARLAAHVLRVFPFRLQPGVRRGSEITHDLFMTGPTFLRADKLRAGDAGRRKDCSVCGAARKQDNG